MNSKCLCHFQFWFPSSPYYILGVDCDLRNVRVSVKNPRVQRVSLNWFSPFFAADFSGPIDIDVTKVYCNLAVSGVLVGLAKGTQVIVEEFLRESF